MVTSPSLTVSARLDNTLMVTAAGGGESLPPQEASFFGSVRFGSGALGPVVVSLSILGVVLAFFGRRVARGQVLTADA